MEVDKRGISKMIKQISEKETITQLSYRRNIETYRAVHGARPVQVFLGHTEMLHWSFRSDTHQ